MPDALNGERKSEQGGGAEFWGVVVDEQTTTNGDRGIEAADAIPPSLSNKTTDLRHPTTEAWTLKRRRLRARSWRIILFSLGIFWVAVILVLMTLANQT